MHELWVAHASRVMTMVSHHRGLSFRRCSEGEALHFRKDCFGATPKSTRETRALPRQSMPSESRIDQLREEARTKGVVTGGGIDVAGGPIPRKPGYYGQPVCMPPGWTRGIPNHFFLGGLAW